MPATSSASTATYVVNVGAVGIVGKFMGLPIDLMVLGAMAGVAMVALQSQTSRKQALGSVVVSVLLASVVSPPAAHAVAREYALDQTSLEYLVAIASGLTWPWIAPVFGTVLKDIATFVTHLVSSVLSGWADRIGRRKSDG